MILSCIVNSICSRPRTPLVGFPRLQANDAHAGGNYFKGASVKAIPLSKGMVAIVDDADFEWLSLFKWHAKRSRNYYYAARSTKRGGRRCIYMHRVIFGTLESKVDHKDGNTLNNRRSNLRRATNTQNVACQFKSKRKTSSKFKGVCLFKQNMKWMAGIASGVRHIHLGYFASEEDAAKAYDLAARKLYKEFARLNFPEIGELPAIR